MILPPCLVVALLPVDLLYVSWRRYVVEFRFNV